LSRQDTVANNDFRGVEYDPPDCDLIETSVSFFSVPPTSRTAGDSTIVTILLRFEAVSLNVLVTWSKEGQIQGVFLRPAEPPKYEYPSYSRPESFPSRDVTIGEHPWKLPATPTGPNGEGPFPGAVLVHGSGPHDRDESVGGVGVFRELAEGLSSKGIAVLRYDKRTRRASRETRVES
jgi:hypothetical protein